MQHGRIFAAKLVGDELAEVFHAFDASSPFFACRH
jgi:hypothetical protein